MVNYQNSKIYKIVCNTTGLIYIGSTAEPTLARRLAKHREDYKRYLIGKHNYITSYKILENTNYDIILLEIYPCNTKDELHARERYYIESNECVNKNIPARTHIDYVKYQKLYREQNKNKIEEKQKQYNEAHKNEIKNYQKQYKKTHREELNEKLRIKRHLAKTNTINKISVENI